MRRRWITVLVFAVAAFAAYHNCFSAPFVFDDGYHIVDNERIRSLWPLWPWLRDSSRPLVQFSLALNFAISGLEVWSYHLFNVLVHLAAALALNGIVRRTLEQSGSERLGRAAHPLAFTIALLWMLHPLQTAGVTYTIQRGESMMGLFCLLTLSCFIRMSRFSAPAPWFIASIACCVLGLASKPIMAVAPILVLLYDRTFVARSFGAAVRLRGIYYATLFGTLMLLPLILAGKAVEWAPTAGFGTAIVTPLEYAATQPQAILRYLRLTFWPDALCLDYGWRPERDATVIAATSLVLAALMFCAIWASRRSRLLGFAIAWFVVTLAPTSSVVPIADLIFEHRMYLALAAVLGVAVIAAFLLIEQICDRLPFLDNRRRAVATAAALIAGLLLTGRTMIRNYDYASDVALWTSAIEVSPQSPRARYNLGTALMRRQRWSEATVHLMEAVKVHPDYADAHYNLGNALLAQGELPNAVMAYHRALTLTPDDWQMHNNLGVAMLNMGDEAAATLEFERTLQLNPQCANARTNLDKLARTVARPSLL